MTPEDKARMRQLTMACWWPCRAMGRATYDWDGIHTELVTLARDEARRGDTTRAEECERLALIAGAGVMYNKGVEERAKRDRRNAARREKHAAMLSLGLVRVRGSLGGVYYE